MAWSRRSFLRTALLGSSAVFSGAVDSALAAMPGGARATAEGYGPLVPDPGGLLELPAGFHYRLLSPGGPDRHRGGDARLDSTLDDGTPTPGYHDGMGAFAGPGGVTILVRNHEMDLGREPFVDPARKRPYDEKLGGGTTTLWVDRDRRLVRSFASLSGTLRNCAGGVTPWGSWLTAEEGTAVPASAEARNADRTPLANERHGYMFEVDARSEGLVAPVPLKAMGRFRHEAVAVDPQTGFAYLTEDRDDALLYRFRPTVRATTLRVGDYARGGVLEALRVRTRHRLETDNRTQGAAMAIGESLDIEWVRIEDPDPDVDMEHPPDRPGDVRTASTATRAQGFANGCARFARTEGIAYSDGSIYFCCTNGGPREFGQVFRIRLREQKLSLIVEPDDHALLDGPDNLCVSPFGDLVICEDSLAGRQNHVVGVTPQGRTYRIARNAHPMNSEFAGACFSPDGGTMFVNVQKPGMTFAIWGPWRTRRA
jgi:secreted PhoX family phosphatase